MERLGGRHRWAAGVSDESQTFSLPLSSAQNTHPFLMELLETESRRWLCLVLKIGPLFPVFGPHPGKVLGIFIWGGGSVGEGEEWDRGILDGERPLSGRIASAAGGSRLLLAGGRGALSQTNSVLVAAESLAFLCNQSLTPKWESLHTCSVPGILGQEQAVPQALTRDPESFVACLVGEQTEFPTRRAGSGNPAPPSSRLESGR